MQMIYRRYLTDRSQIITPEAVSIPGDHGDCVTVTLNPLNLFEMLT